MFSVGIERYQQHDMGYELVISGEIFAKQLILQLYFPLWTSLSAATAYL